MGRALYYTKQSADGQTQIVQYAYDEKNNLTGLTESVGNSTQGYVYQYDPNERLISMTVGDTTVSYQYDDFRRLSQKITKQGETVVKTETYTYFNPTTTTTSAQIAEYRVVAGGRDITYLYTYDMNGNILTIGEKENNITKTIRYEYDAANQLTAEYNEAGEYAHFWTYDNAGNIQSRTEYAYVDGVLGEVTDTVSYTYGDTGPALEPGEGELPILPIDGEATNTDAWGDLLTAYDNQGITYDNVGNPVNDGTWAYEWQRGRQLKSMTHLVDNTVWTYTYDANGMRTGRTNGTTTYNYTYNGSQLVQMTVGSDTLRFTYDAAGTPLTVTYNGTTYYYTTNLQGDVVAIVNAGGVEQVRYTYGAWGQLLATEGTLATTLGVYNPLRYRGYVYDTETALYYLQSRYYDPEVGRFINADKFASTGQGVLGNNMFAYCANCTPNNADASGNAYYCAFNGELNVAKPQAFINGQELEPYNSIPMGHTTVGFAGCGPIATYNLAHILGRTGTTLYDMLDYYEKNNAYILGGYRGTDIYTMQDYFDEQGYLTIIADYKNPDMFSVMPHISKNASGGVVRVQISLTEAHFMAFRQIGDTTYFYNAFTKVSYATPVHGDFMGYEKKYGDRITHVLLVFDN